MQTDKGSDNQAFPIPAAYKKVIQTLKAEYKAKGKTVTPETPLLLSQKGENRPITRQQASQIIRKTAKNLNITGKINKHSFRKSFVSKIYSMTRFNIVETQTYSRHKNLTNLQYYIQTTNDTGLVKDLSWT